MKEIKDTVVTKEQPKQQTKPRRCNKVLTAVLLVLMAVVGMVTFFIGVVDIYGCGNAMVIPVMLMLNGLLWLLPPLLVALVNCVCCRHDDDPSCMYGCLEKLFFFSVAFLVASTIYVLVTVTQVKALSTLCTRPWVPPYVLCLLVADWVCFIVFVRLFCSHPAAPCHAEGDSSSTTQFKHLKNLPPLSWNRHRALRTH
ncbi:uncharacterized protein LOC143297918 [Babylonia areolata]|uniref:uncharacterized protein LOC143297918 n=1 Tax=Babylonia areolata TaxID=304850 RepID=UPI003FD5CA7A